MNVGTFHCLGNFILKTRPYSILQFWEMMHFLPCATFVENEIEIFVLVLCVASTLLSEVE